MNDNDDDDKPGHWITLQDLVHHINSHERPREEFRAAMIFILSTLAIDPDDMNDALCEAFAAFEKSTVARRRKLAEDAIKRFQ
jgi:hypothetical protein